MAKDWIKFSNFGDINVKNLGAGTAQDSHTRTKNDKQAMKADRYAANAIQTAARSKTLKNYEALKKEGDTLASAKKSYEDALVIAYTDKKLKSETKIAEAENIIAIRKKRENKKGDNKNGNKDRESKSE